MKIFIQVEALFRVNSKVIGKEKADELDEEIIL